MKAIIELDIPEWQIGKEVDIYFPDTMHIKGTVTAKECCDHSVIRETDKVNCGETNCNNCVNHNYCDYEDAVSREAAKKLYCNICMDKNICYRNKENCEELNLFENLPSVTPKQRTGQWVKIETGHSVYYKCSECDCIAPCTEVCDDFIWKLSAYCPDCGKKMENGGG